MHKNFLIVILFLFSSFTLLAQYPQPIEKDGLWGYEVPWYTGDIVIDYQYLTAQKFTYDKAIVSKAEGYGVINDSNEVVIPLKYLAIRKVNDQNDTEKQGIYLAKNKSNKWGLISESRDNPLLPFEYDSLQMTLSDVRVYNTPLTSVMKNSQLKALKNGKWGIVDLHNNIIVPFKYDFISNIGKRELQRFHIRREVGKLYERPRLGHISGKKLLFKIFADQFLVKKGERNFLLRDKKLFKLPKGQYESIYSDKDDLLESEIFIVVNDKKFGLANKKKIVQPIKFDKLDYFFYPYFYSKKDSKYGILDSLGKELFSPQFSYVKGNFVRKTGVDAGVLNYTLDNYIVQPVYDGINLRKNDNGDTILVHSTNNVVGFLDIDGHQVLPNIYNESWPYRNGKIRVKKDNLYGIVDLENTPLLSIEHDKIDPLPWWYWKEMADAYIVKTNGLFGIIRDGNNWVLPAQYDTLKHEKKEIYAKENGNDWKKIDLYGNALTDKTYEKIYQNKVMKNGKWGYLDDDNQLLIPCEYDNIYYPKNGLFEVVKDGKHGLVDSSNQIVYDVIYEDIDDDSFIINLKKNGKWAFGDFDGKIFSTFKYDEIDYQTEYFIEVYSSGKMGFINHQMKEVLPPIYDKITRTNSSFVKLEKDNFYGISDYYGNVKLPCAYENITFNDLNDLNFIPVKRGEDWVFIDSTGTQTIDDKFTTVNNFPKNQYSTIVNKEGKDFLLAKNGILLTKGYDKLEKMTFSKSNVSVYQDRKYGVIKRSNGKILLPIQYDKKVKRADNSKLYFVSIKDKYGLVDTNNVVIVDITFKQPFIFSRNIVYQDTNKVFLKNGMPITPLPIDDTYNYLRNGFQKLRISISGIAGTRKEIGEGYKQFIAANGSASLISASSDTLFTTGLKRIDSVDRGFITATDRNNKNGFYDIKEKRLAPFDYIQYYTNINTPVRWVFINGEGYLVDSTLTLLHQQPFEGVGIYSDGLIAVQYNNKVGFRDDKGQLIIDHQYDHDYTSLLPFTFENGIAYVYKNGKYGFINKKNEMVLPFEYDVVLNHTAETTLAFKEGKWEIINWNMIKQK